MSSYIPASCFSATSVLEQSAPQRGEVWVASASAILPVLQAVAAHSAVGLSLAMHTRLTALEGSGESLPHRPCVILDTREHRDTCDVVVFTTLGHGRTHVSETSLHFQHFALSVGKTPPWPNAASWVLKTQPDWRAVPQWATGILLELPRSSLLHRYRKQHGGARTYFNCDDRSLVKLEGICLRNLAVYRAMTPEQHAEWNRTYKLSKHHSAPSVVSQGPVLNPATHEFVPRHRAVTEAVYTHTVPAWPGFVAPLLHDSSLDMSHAAVPLNPSAVPFVPPPHASTARDRISIAAHPGTDCGPISGASRDAAGVPMPLPLHPLRDEHGAPAPSHVGDVPTDSSVLQPSSYQSPNPSRGIAPVRILAQPAAPSNMSVPDIEDPDEFPPLGSPSPMGRGGAGPLTQATPLLATVFRGRGYNHGGNPADVRSIVFRHLGANFTSPRTAMC